MTALQGETMAKPQNPVSQRITARFVGREIALKAFNLRFSYRAMKNGIYYYGSGGSGKTWLLKKIILENCNNPNRTVTELIDFLDTKNHSKRGLQTSIKSRLGNNDQFAAYDAIIRELETVIQNPPTERSSSLILSLENQADQAFISCCKESTSGQEVVLLFDTFERVQNQEAGKWLMQEFLTKVNEPVIAIAGRATVSTYKMPDNILPFALGGLNREETSLYMHKLLGRNVTEDEIQIIYEHTGGAPLIMDLIAGLPVTSRKDFIESMRHLGADAAGRKVRVQDSDFLKCALVKRFGQNDRNSKFNWIVWIMAFLKRRFDVRMLRYVIDNMKPEFEPIDYKNIYHKIETQVIVKEYPEQQSHLLHDEIQRLIEECILNDEASLFHDQLKDKVYETVVGKYYSEVLLPNASIQETKQLEAERLGYLLDSNIDQGIEVYRQMWPRFENDFDFEELLWVEMHGYKHLASQPDKGLNIYRERGRWLLRRGRFSQAEDHFREMLDLFPNEQIEISLSLGNVLMRQGKYSEATAVYEKGRVYAQAHQDPRNIVQFDLLLAQLARRMGNWAKALKWYANSSLMADRHHFKAELASAYFNRAYILSLLGRHEQAQKECQEAIVLLESLEPTDDISLRKAYAWMNYGTASRHSGDYDRADVAYRQSIKLAEKVKNKVALYTVSLHLGSNRHIIGRDLRRKENTTAREIAQACRRQAEAWKFLVDGLEMARETDDQAAIADGLCRLARVYREMYHLTERLPKTISMDSDVIRELQVLEDKVLSFQMDFELKYKPELIFPGEFSLLDWRKKAGRLFDVSALVADEASEYHRALDSLTELSRTLLWVGLLEEATLVINRIQRMKKYDYQERLFAASVEILKGELALRRGNLLQALARYQKGYVDLALSSGFATYELNNRLRDLEWRIREDVPEEQRVEWCDMMEMAWIEAGIASEQPQMIEWIEELRSEIAGKRSKQNEQKENGGEV